MKPGLNWFGFYNFKHMSTLNEHIYNIRDLANGGRSNRAVTYGDRQIAHWVMYWRNFLMKNDIKKKGYVDIGYEQDLGCLTLTKADAAMCSKYCFGESVYYIELPELLDLPDNMGLTFFGLVDKQTRINVSDYAYGSYHKFQRFVPKKKIWAQKQRNTIFLHNVDDIFPIKAVNARGVFADPANLSTCPCDGGPLVCFDWDKDCYPVPPSQLSTLYDLIMEREVGIARAAPKEYEDNENTKTPL